MKKKRTIYRLKWDKTWGDWLLRGPDGICPLPVEITKEAAEQSARAYCRGLGSPVQLLIYTKAGKIGKGGRYEASYNCDSRRRHG